LKITRQVLLLKSRYIAALCAAAALVGGTMPAFAYNSEMPDVSAEAAVLFHPQSGRILFEKNPNERMLIASTTKIMTAVLALEKCTLDEAVRVVKDDADTEGSSAYLKAGERLTVRDLLAGMLLASGNDAAVALACHVSGDIDSFVALMNDTARRCGAVSSVFADPNGLDDVNQRTTAADLACITRAALAVDEFRELVSTKQYSCPGHVFVNHNKLLAMCQGAVGVKTGYTKAAGRALVSLIERQDMQLICVTLDAPDDWNDHMSLAAWAQDNFRKVTLCREGEVYASLPVISGKSESVAVIADRTITKIVPKANDYAYTAVLPRFAYAPVKAGDAVGYIDVPGDRAMLTAAEDVLVDESQRLGPLARFKRGFTDLFPGE